MRSDTSASPGFQSGKDSVAGARRSATSGTGLLSVVTIRAILSPSFSSKSVALTAGLGYSDLWLAWSERSCKRWPFASSPCSLASF